MSWHYLPELAAEYSAGNCSDGEPCAPLKSTHSVGRCCLDANWMDAYRSSLSGTTSEHSTANPGAGASMSSAGGSRAKTLVALDLGVGWMGNKVDYGRKCHGSFAKYNQNSRSWKTHQLSLRGELVPFCGTWPKWGLMLSGECWALHPVVHRSNVSGFGLPAPTKSMGKRGWGISKSGRERYSKQLQENAQVFGYKPHPAILEWSMGWIPMWTRLAPLETGKFQQWLDSHGEL